MYSNRKWTPFSPNKRKTKDDLKTTERQQKYHNNNNEATARPQRGHTQRCLASGVFTDCTRRTPLIEREREKNQIE